MSLNEDDGAAGAAGEAAADAPGRATAATSAEIGPAGASAGAGAAITGTGSTSTASYQPADHQSPQAASASGIEVGDSAKGISASASHASATAEESSAEALAIGFSGLPKGDVSGRDGGMTAGIFLRIDHQTDSNWLFGAELSLNKPGGSSASGSDTSTFGLSTPDYTSPELVIRRAITLDTSALVSARLRLGYAMGDYLVYGTGGLAYARYTATATTTGSFDGVQASEVMRASDNAFGGVIGGGVSTFVADNATLSIEGLYYRFGGETHFKGGGGASAGLDDAFSLMTTFSIRAN